MTNAVFHKDMPIDVYHGHRDIISKSMLGDLADCPARFKHKYIDGNIPEPTKSLRMGNATHVLALEPEHWKANYHVLPEYYFNDKGEKKSFRMDKRMSVVQDEFRRAGHEPQMDEAGKVTGFLPGKDSKVVLSQEEFRTVEAMANAVAKNNYACQVLQAPGYVESSIFWDQEVLNPDTGEMEIVKLRCRPDLNRNDSLQADLKIARSVEPEQFFKDSYFFHYDLSVAMIDMGYQALHGKEPDNYVFVAVEQESPHLVECYHSLEPMEALMGLTYLEYGRLRLNKLLQRYVQCRARGAWPSYQEKIGGMKIPPFAIRQFIEEGE